MVERSLIKRLKHTLLSTLTGSLSAQELSREEDVVKSWCGLSTIFSEPGQAVDTSWFFVVFSERLRWGANILVAARGLTKYLVRFIRECVLIFCWSPVGQVGSCASCYIVLSL